MYKNILAAVNEYTNSEVAARYALAMARHCGARLTLISVAAKGEGPDSVRRAESALERLFAEAVGAGIEAESIVETGDPVARITGHVLEHGVDLAFVATRREDVAGRFFVRTVSRELMARLSCGAVMVRAVRPGKVAPRNILVPLRGGLPFDVARADFVACLAGAFGSRVTLFHLVEPVTSFFHGEVRLRPAEREGRIPKDVRDLAEALRGRGIPVDEKTAHGGISRAITAEAALGRDDLIVMGASRRGLPGTVMKGNPVEEVLRETPCNLMIFRPGNEHTEPL